MMASKRASSSAYEVSMRQCTSGIDRADLAADLDAAAVGQPNVEHRDVGPGRGDAVERVGGGAGLADDLHVPLEPDQVGEAPSDDLVVVHEEHADGAVAGG